jgi:ADP-ribose pyrophosphatase YjhB (NUDIX family)
MTSTTATVMLIDPVAKDLIIPVRGDHVWVYPSMDSLMGGFMEARYVEEGETEAMKDARAYADRVLGFKYIADEYHEGENSVECGQREGHEELGIQLDPSQLKLFDVRANARTDTRAHVTNCCYYAVLTPVQVAALTPGDDIQSFHRLPIADLHLEIPYAALQAKYPMAFNHFELMMQGLAAYEREERYFQMEGELIALRMELEQARGAASKAQSDAAWETAAHYGQQGGI